MSLGAEARDMNPKHVNISQKVGGDGHESNVHKP
jgi:hypothetical protein